ncbi:MAG: hypothetical protein GXW90_03425 [Tepidanaerobacter acetatoxydans]|uniref:hypothetical protein n=1 Tax=Tepidanaerobacter TaxID=499228 RepID=UPI000A8BD02E|nr:MULTISPECIES: hypothetical protein [Tepidanaerobacter]NLU09991.1 hypothetical protein [Tepidanaerobacter acetatoxydans]
MGDVKNFSPGYEDEITTPVIYLLLMANVLGLVVFLDDKMSKHTSIKKNGYKNHPRNHAMKQIVKTLPTIYDKNIMSELTTENELTSDDNIPDKKDKDKNKDVVLEQIEQTIEQIDKEIPKHRDYIIRFKETTDYNKQVAKQPLEPLVWHFPIK